MEHGFKDFNASRKAYINAREVLKFHSEFKEMIGDLDKQIEDCENEGAVSDQEGD
jgi:hypothetical protein